MNAHYILIVLTYLKKKNKTKEIFEKIMMKRQAWLLIEERRIDLKPLVNSLTHSLIRHTSLIFLNYVGEIVKGKNLDSNKLQ